MNIALLKLARRDYRGVRTWIVPGFGNGAKYVPERYTPTGWGPALYWPAIDARGECVRGADLWRHRKLAKAEIRKLLNPAT